MTAVEPGPFRTDWAGRSLKTPRQEIADYADTAGARRALIQGYSGEQPGDLVRAAEAIITAVCSPPPPLHLVLGRVALVMVRTKLASLAAELDTWQDVTLSADFPEDA